MTQRVIESPLEAGRAALRRQAWREAYDHLTAADGGALTADDLEGLQKAAWLTGRLERSLAAGERAFAMHLAGGDSDRAALVALALAKDNYMRSAATVGAAWFARAEKLIANLPRGPVHGWLARFRGVLAFEGDGDIEKGLTYAEEALQLATEFGDVDLLALAVNDKGRMLVERGDFEEGMRFVDESSVAAVSGELGPLTTGFIYCNTIAVCEGLADYRRAGDWTEAAKRWCERQSLAGFPGLCRVHRAGIIRLRGSWSEAETEARRACEELASFKPSAAAEGFYEIGEVRRRVGDLAAAEEAYRQAHELGRDPQPGLALVRLAQGNVAAAAACVRRALDADALPLHRARLLPATVEVGLAAGDPAWAEEAAAELEETAGRYGTTALRAMAADARGRIQLAAGEANAAAHTLRRAVQLWQELDAPYEAAIARLELARAYRAAGDADAAAMELGAARSVLERLGAAADLRRATQLLQAGDRAPAPRAQKTFMFTDICKSTNLVDVIGDDAWNDLVAWHDRTLRTHFVAHGGEEVDHAGDGFFVAFERPSSAVGCAVAIQRTLAEHRGTHGFAPQVRIGLHAAEATHVGDGYKGKGVHAAARIGAAAERGEILASRTTIEGAAMNVETADARVVTLKGLADPVEVVAIEWRTEGARA